MDKKRITKDPLERKNEIMDTAMELFLKNGFEQTPISSIVKKINVAQGTFYHYFDSKDSLLEEVLQRHTSNMILKIKNFVEDEDHDFYEKIRKIESIIISFGYSNSNENMLNYVHKQENNVLHQKLIFYTLKNLLPYVLQTINQGIKEKILDLQFPEETAQILLYGISSYIHNTEHFFDDKDVYNKNMKAIEYIVNRSLGIKDK